MSYAQYDMIRTSSLCLQPLFQRFLFFDTIVRSFFLLHQNSNLTHSMCYLQPIKPTSRLRFSHIDQKK